MHMRYATWLAVLALMGGAGCGSDSPPATNDASVDAAVMADAAVSDAAPSDAAASDAASDAGSAAGTARIHVRALSGAPLSGAEVTIGDASMTTDAAGDVTFTGLAASERVVAIARVPGNPDAYALVTPSADRAVDIRIDIAPSRSAVITQAVSETTIVNVAGTEIALPPRGLLVAQDGTPYTDAVEVRFAELTGSLANLPLPTSTHNGFTIQENSAAVFDVAIYGTDASANVALQPLSPIPFRRAIELDTATVEALTDGDSTLRLSSFDAATGEWRDDGVLSYDDGVVSGAFAHFTLYRVNIVGALWPASGRHETDVATGCARGRVTHSDGSPYVNANVAYVFDVFPAGRRSDFYRTRIDMYTDADGYFCAAMPRAGQTATVRRYNPVTNAVLETRTNLVVEPITFWIDYTRIAMPTPPVANSAVCSTGCADWGTLIHPNSPPLPAPTCAANAALCDDGNPCTTDTCNASATCPAAGCSGCTNAITATASCDDGNACTTNDTCNSAGLCVGGAPTACDDSNACTKDYCDTLAGGCATMAACAFDPNSVCDGTSGAPVCGCASGYVRGASPLCRPSAPTCESLSDAIDDVLACPEFDRTVFTSDVECGAIEYAAGDSCYDEWVDFFGCVSPNVTAHFSCRDEADSGIDFAIGGACRPALDAVLACVSVPEPSRCEALADGISANVDCPGFLPAMFVSTDCPQLDVPATDDCFDESVTVFDCFLADPAASFGCDPEFGMSTSGVEVGDRSPCHPAIEAFFDCMDP